jgi:Uri superfamily endonuclease
LKPGSGIYLLYFNLGDGQEVNVGRLGRAFFPGGFYVYVGSAQKNLPQRLARHLRNAKNRGTLSALGGCPINKTPGGVAQHWHIDYLLPHAKILSIHVYRASREWECRLGRKLAGLKGARVIMKGFGSSDCKCTSHLYYFPSRQHFKGTFLAMGVVRGQDPLTLSIKNTVYPSPARKSLTLP